MLQFVIFIFFQMESDTINCEGNRKENEEENKETVVDPAQNVEKNTESTSALSQTPEPSVIPLKRKRDDSTKLLKFLKQAVRLHKNMIARTLETGLQPN